MKHGLGAVQHIAAVALGLEVRRRVLSGRYAESSRIMRREKIGEREGDRERQREKERERETERERDREREGERESRESER